MCHALFQGLGGRFGQRIKRIDLFQDGFHRFDVLTFCRPSVTGCPAGLTDTSFLSEADAKSFDGRTYFVRFMYRMPSAR